MPAIDVSDVILDADIAGEAFIVIRRREGVNIFGEVETFPQAMQAFGSITPTGDNSTIRDESFLAISNGIRVITPFALIGPEKAAELRFQPDIINWNGESFIVKSLNDYSNYGAGFVDAVCLSIALTSPDIEQPSQG